MDSRTQSRRVSRKVPLHAKRVEELTAEERAELVRDFLNDPAAMRRAAERYAAGLSEDAATA